MTEHGITTSDAHHWAHVSPLEHLIYVYDRLEMLAYLPTVGEWRQKEIRSAFGYVVPKTAELIWCFDVDCGPAQAWHDAASDNTVGRMAEAVFRTWCQQPANCLHLCQGAPLTTRLSFAESLAEQCLHDFTVRVEYAARVEVKADIPAATTGNLFIQTHERFHQHQQRNGHRVVTVAQPGSLF